MHDVRDAPLDDATLTRFLAVFPDSLVNKRSTAWRNLTEAERTENPIALLQAHPALMKRPLIEAGGSLYLGWSAETEQAIISGQTPSAL